MIWPLFLALMSITLTEWKKKAYRFIVGNSLSDFCIAYLSYSWLILRWRHDGWIGKIVWIIWALIFAIYWISLIYKKETPKDITVDTHTTKRHTSNIAIAARWFLMNLVNPSIFIFWITVLSHFIRKQHHAISPTITRTFLGSILLTFIITDVIKVHGASWILKKLTLKTLDKIHTIAWILLISAWIIILVRTIL